MLRAKNEPAKHSVGWVGDCGRIGLEERRGLAPRHRTTPTGFADSNC